MDVIKNIDRKILALQEAEVAMLTLNSHLEKEYFPSETLAMISELKVDLVEIRDAQEHLATTFGPLANVVPGVG
mgnify:CR=1 FL=1